MSIIASTFNTGTGLSSAVTNEGQLPIVVDDLTVNGNLTVIETTYLNGQTTINNNLIVSGTTFTENIVNNNNLIVLGGIGQDGLNTFKVPPTNGTTDQILTITDDTANPILTEWKDPPNTVIDYVQYDPLTEVFKRNFNLVITQINNLNLDYLNIASDLSVLGLTELSTTIINDNLTVAEITTTDNLVVNTNSVLKGKIGPLNTQLFSLPGNTSTSTAGQILSILNGTTKTTQWINSPPTITDYVQYNTTTNKLYNILTASNIVDLVIDNTIGGSKFQRFKLPTNTTTANNGDTLQILDASASPITTTWASSAVLLPDYVSYDTTTNILSNNPSLGLPTNITTLRITTIGRGLNTYFTLPTNTSTTPNFSRLVLNDNVTGATEWRPSSGAVSYDTTTKFLRTENSSGSIPDITDLAVTKIGATNAQLFSLPANTSSATAGQILSILNGTTKTTQWVTQSAPVTNYASYNTTSKVLINNVSGTPTDITDLAVTKIGATNAQIFSLPTNTSSVSAGQILSIFNASTKTTQWINAPPTITDYTSYDTTGAGFTNNLNGTPTSITNIATQNIGYTLSEKFTLPVNTSTATVGQILSISIASPNKQTQWINAPPTINNYMSYNTSTNQIINNVSGTPTTISGLNIGPLTCTTINTQNSNISCGGGNVNAGTIQASVNLFSTGGIITNNGTNDTCTIDNTGQLICKNFLIRDPSTLVSPLSLSATGDIICKSINTQNSTISCGSGNVNASTITASSNLVSTGGIVALTGSTFTFTVENNGKMSCKDILVRDPFTGVQYFTVSPSGDVLGNGCDFVRFQSTGLNIFNTLTAGVFGTLQASITNAGALTCKGVDSGSSLIKTTGNVETSKIGATTAQLFSLPTNTSSATANQVLSILDGTTKTTQWVSPITNYVSYNTSTNILVNNVSGTATNIQTLVLPDTLGISFAERFSLPANTTISSNNYVLSLSSVSFKTTQWVPAAIIPTTTETSITTAVATATNAVVEMCRATSLVAGTYIITYQVEPEITTTSRAFSYISYGVSTTAGSLINNGIVGLNYADSTPYTAPATTASTLLRYSGSGVTVLSATTTLYLLVRFVYTGTTFNTKGTMRVTKIA
jgi:hypothetical protein